MARTGGLIHSKLPSDAIIHTRQPVKPETVDEERESSAFDVLGEKRFTEALEVIARAAENRSNPVDEYNSAALSGAGSSAFLTVQPTYEYMAEKIEAVIVTGPAGNITLQLGDRLWALTIPTTQILVIAPIAILLSRTDTRMLTPATPGPYTLELTGIADRRFQI